MDSEAVRQQWVDATLEPVHQANPIERDYSVPDAVEESAPRNEGA